MQSVQTRQRFFYWRRITPSVIMNAHDSYWQRYSIRYASTPFFSECIEAYIVTLQNSYVTGSFG